MLFSFSKSKKRRKLEKEGLASSKKRLKQEDTFGHAVNKSKVISIFILVSIWFFCMLALLIPNQENELGFLYLVQNQLAPETVHAEFKFSYLDKKATRINVEKSKRNEPRIYKINEEKSEASLRKAKELFDGIVEFKRSGVNNLGKLPKDLSDGVNLAKELPADAIDPLYEIASDKKKRALFMDKLSEILYKGIIDTSEEDLPDYWPGMTVRVINKKDHLRPIQALIYVLSPLIACERFSRNVAEDYPKDKRITLQRAVYEFSLYCVTDNLTFDKEMTDKNIAEAAVSKKNLVYGKISKGDLIVARGEKVTPEILNQFNTYEKIKSSKSTYANFWIDFLKSAVQSFFVMLITGIYFYHLHPRILKSNQKMGVIGAVIVISLFSVLLADKGFYMIVANYNLPVELKSSLIPVALASILLSALVGLRVAIYVGLLISLIAALRNDSFNLILTGMAVSCIAGYAVRRARNYKSYCLRAILAISLTVIVAESVILIQNIMQGPDIIPWIIGFGITNGIITGLIALVLVFIIESLFQISTDMTLLTLSDYNHPLLKRLQLEAPGTYHHCLIVATLAEQAATCIGASPIRARVCALFHDIGKLAKPEYFTENNLAGKNYHDELHPRMSSIIILNHVKEGVYLAIKHKLSKIIRDAIEQHHGTDLVYYFYRRAVDENISGANPINENEYRYPGPKPIEKEVVLVSLADSCEAASRSLDKVTPSKIETLVMEIIRKRIREGQLDNADLTFSELAKARESFVKTLSSMLHGRINYPKDEDDDNEGDLFNAAKKQLKSKNKDVSPPGKEGL